MNRIQYITVTHDFFLVTIAGRCLITDKLQQAGIGSADAFNLIGSLSTLNFCDFNKPVKLRRLLLQIKLMPALVFMNLCHKPDDLAVPRTACKYAVTSFPVFRS